MNKNNNYRVGAWLSVVGMRMKTFKCLLNPGNIIDNKLSRPPKVNILSQFLFYNIFIYLYTIKLRFGETFFGYEI